MFSIPARDGLGKMPYAPTEMETMLMESIRSIAAAASSGMVRERISEVTSATERVSQGSEELAGLAEELRKLVGAFKIEGGEQSKGLLPLQDGKRKNR